MRVALFVTCLVDGMYPGVAKATVTVLERLGCTVDFPAAQTCCGQMHWNTGYQADAHALAQRWVTAFTDTSYDAIVAPSGSCAAMVRHHYARIGDQLGLPDFAAELSAKTYELAEFIVDVLGVEDVGATYPHRVTYHPTCHSLRLLRVGDKPLRLLRQVRGIELVEIYRMTPGLLEDHYFSKWERKWHESGGKDINNPKIPIAYVRSNGEEVYRDALDDKL